MRSQQLAPNRIIFWLIIFSLFGSMGSAYFGSPRMPTTLILLSMLVLPIRNFIRWPLQELKAVNKEATAQLIENGALAIVQERTLTLAKAANFAHPIQVVVSQYPSEHRSFGSFYHRYLWLGYKDVQKLADDLQNPQHRATADALLLHEIGHFANQDIARIGYIRELLRTSTVVLLLWFILTLGSYYLTLLIIPPFMTMDFYAIEGLDAWIAGVLTNLRDFMTDIPTEDILSRFAEVSYPRITIFLISAFLYHIITLLILWLIYWRQMVYEQEFYADQFAVDMQGNDLFLQHAWARYIDFSGQSERGKSIFPQIRRLFNRQFRWVSRVLFIITELPLIARFTDLYYQYAAGLFQFHPPTSERIEFLKNPLARYNNWLRYAIPITLLTIALELSMSSMTARNTAANYPGLIPSLVLILVVSAFSLPILAKRSGWIFMLKIIATAFGLRVAWFLLNISGLFILAFVNPNLTEELLCSYLIASFARISTSHSLDCLSQPMLEFVASVLTLSLRNNLAYFAGTIGAIKLLQWGYQQLNVYSILQFPKWAQPRWHTAYLLYASALATILIFVPINHIVLGDYGNLITRPQLIWSLVALSSLAIIVVWFKRRTA